MKTFINFIKAVRDISFAAFFALLLLAFVAQVYQNCVKFDAYHPSVFYLAVSDFGYIAPVLMLYSLLSFVLSYLVIILIEEFSTDKKCISKTFKTVDEAYEWIGKRGLRWSYFFATESKVLDPTNLDFQETRFKDKYGHRYIVRVNPLQISFFRMMIDSVTWPFEVLNNKNKCHEK